MKKSLPALLVLCVATLSVQAADIIRMPFAAHPKIDPLRVNSPVEIQWNGGKPAVVEIFREGVKKIFPKGHPETSVASGSEFQLDHGLYLVEVRHAVGESPLPYSAHKRKVWIEVLPAPKRFDLRDSDPVQQCEIDTIKVVIEKEFRKVHGKVQDVERKVNGLNEKADEQTQSIEALSAKIDELIENFSVSVFDETGKEIQITRPLQWMTDRIGALEAELVPPPK